MPSQKPGRDEKNKAKIGSSNPDGHALIASTLRGYYESIVEEGTPDQILDLLHRLDAAERQSKTGG